MPLLYAKSGPCRRRCCYFIYKQIVTRRKCSVVLSDNDPLETQRRRLRVTPLPLPDSSSDPAIGASAATGDAGQLPSRQPLLAVVDDQFGMLLAADEEAR